MSIEDHQWGPRSRIFPECLRIWAGLNFYDFFCFCYAWVPRQKSVLATSFSRATWVNQNQAIRFVFTILGFCLFFVTWESPFWSSPKNEFEKRKRDELTPGWLLINFWRFHDFFVKNTAGCLICSSRSTRSCTENRINFKFY